MGRQVIIADAGPIFSLAVIDRLDIFELLFGNVLIPPAVWAEVTSDATTGHHQRIFNFFHNRVRPIEGVNELALITDRGESEAITLCKEIGADFLLIDDKKARHIAETLGIKCVGTLGVLSVAKTKGLITDLRPLFELLIRNRRYYGISLLNSLLQHHGEKSLNVR